MATSDRSRSVLDGIKQGASELLNMGSTASSLTSDLQALVRSEVDLAKAEINQQVNRAIRASIWFAVAAVFAYFTLLFLMVGAMFGLMEVFDEWWIAALIVAGGALLIAGIAALIGRARLKQIHLVPERTIRTSKENITWARNQLKSNGVSSSNAETPLRR